MDRPRAALEDDVRDRCERGDAGGAVTAALRGYGPEVYGFLRAVLRDAAEADDAFSRFSEALWKGLPGFEWRSSLRTWLYLLARHAAAREPRRARRAELPLDDASALERLAVEVRTETQSFLRTEKRVRFAAIRAALPTEDQMLLVLRVDRGLSWEDLARTTLEAQEPGEAALRREAARLRKRFERLRGELVARARSAGLLAATRR